MSIIVITQLLGSVLLSLDGQQPYGNIKYSLSVMTMIAESVYRGSDSAYSL